MLSAAASPFCRPIAPEGAFCIPEEDPFLLLESSLKAIERILLLRRGLPLHRTWIEQPYGEEEITLLEEEVIPAIQQCLARVDELDERLLAQQELLHRCQLEAEREVLGDLRCKWPEGHRRGLRPPSPIGRRTVSVRSGWVSP